MMHECLVNKYPTRFDIPSETEIQLFITAEVATRNQRANRCSSTAQTMSTKSRMSALYVYYLTKRFNETGGTLKPRDGLTYLKDVCDPSTEDFPTDKQIKSKVSAMKSKFKGCMRLPDLPVLPSDLQSS